MSNHGDERAFGSLSNGRLMQRSYEELLGGMGADIAYRGERRPVRLLKQPEAAQIDVRGHDGTVQTFPLHDFAMSGIAFNDQGEHDWQIGDFFWVRVKMYDFPLYEGQARIARFVGSGARRRVAMFFLQGCLDPLELQLN